MERSAHVNSVDALRDLKNACVEFSEDGADALVIWLLEVRKAVQWLEHDRTLYWPDQVRSSHDQLAEARAALSRCEMRYGTEEAPACYEQKKAFEAAKRRLRLCEDKVRSTKKWILAVRQEINQFEGESTKLSNWIESELPRAIASLERMIRALDKYSGDSTTVSPPSVSAGSIPTPDLPADESHDVP